MRVVKREVFWMAEGTKELDSLLELVVEMGGSDLHISTGEPPIVRVVGEMCPLRLGVITQPDFERLIRPAIPERLWNHFASGHDVDWAYESSVGRFRSNLFWQERGGAAVFRLIQSTTVNLKDLGLPPQILRFTTYHNGLVLVTGPTGSGKSTTLAALIDHINSTKRCHILTIEDPIEFIHHDKMARISQREIGSSARSFAAALKVALREDPDVLLIGELRDLETISMALQAAETGILVFSTLHTRSASRTVDRLINVFPASEQEAVRTLLAQVLRGVLAQQLLPRRLGGLIPAVEILFWTTGLPNMIREGKPHLIDNLIKTSRKAGMIGMDDSLLELVRSGEVEPIEAYRRALDKGAFRQALQNMGIRVGD